jgi:hypothetical protein
MLGTPIAILAAVALLIPGFIVAELALAGSAKARRSEGLWTLDERVQPERGVYVPATQIARVDLLLLGDRGILSS